MEWDTIFGHHSILHALKNRVNVENAKLHCTQKGLEILSKDIPKDLLKKITLVNYEQVHDFHQWCAKHWLENKWSYNKITSQSVLLIPSKIVHSPDFLWEKMGASKLPRMIMLDGITDIHNAGAILRTSAFYNVSFVIMSVKGPFGLTPGLFHCASGGIEYLELIKTPSMPNLIQKLVSKDVLCVGLSQHAPSFQEEPVKVPGDAKGICLVLGEEQNGISHANLRVLPIVRSLKNSSDFKGLNVSVAAAIAMENFFNT